MDIPITQRRGLHRLSTKAVEHAAPGTHSDGGGLYLRVLDTGASWIFRYTSPSGQRREMGLGSAERANIKVAGTSLSNARKLAAEARACRQAGGDPIDHRTQQRHAAAQLTAQIKATRKADALTLARCARDYHARVIEPTRTLRHAATWISSLEMHVPRSIWHAPIASITPIQLLDCLTPLYQTITETASRVRQRLDAVFENAVLRGAATTNPAAAIKRELRETTARRQTRSLRALDYRRAPALCQRLGEETAVAARALELAMLTAARTSEVLNARWEEFDLEGRRWVVPAARMKLREPHTVYLSDATHAVLMRLNPAGDGLLFPSAMRSGRPLSNMAMLELLKRIGWYESTTTHGLRATFSTWANEQGFRPDVIEACLAHREQDLVRRAYNRATFAEERRDVLSRWADFLLSRQRVVIPLPSRRMA